MAGSVTFPAPIYTLPVLPVTTSPIYDEPQTIKKVTPMIIFKPTQVNKPVEDKPKETMPVTQPGDNSFWTYVIIGVCALIVLNVLGKRK